MPPIRKAEQEVINRLDRIAAALERVEGYAEEMAKEEAHREEAAALAVQSKPEVPPPLPPPPPPDKCKLCNHTKSLHEPVAANRCFAPNCKCSGWKV